MPASDTLVPLHVNHNYITTMCNLSSTSENIYCKLAYWDTDRIRDKK